MDINRKGNTGGHRRKEPKPRDIESKLAVLQPFGHQGSVLWKTIFPWNGVGGVWRWDGLGMIHEHYMPYIQAHPCHSA